MNPAQVDGAKRGWATRRQRDACWGAKHGMRKRPARWRCEGCLVCKRDYVAARILNAINQRMSKALAKAQGIRQ